MRAEAALSQARTNLSYTEIKAPLQAGSAITLSTRARWSAPRSDRLSPSSSSIRSMWGFRYPTAELQDFLDQVKGAASTMPQSRSTIGQWCGL